MLQVHVEADLAVSPAALWELVRDFGGVKRWTPEITSCELEGSGVGAVRVVTMQGFTIRERLESLDEAARTLSYSIVEGPLPLKDYLSTMRISDGAAGGSHLIWSSTFEAAGIADDQATRLVTSVYRQGIAAFRKVLAA